ncbi:hypothetical protein [Nocardioides panzhihuensis]|uniref:Uncharacterized protein n=1 Tax=Nocardioides panzhihuensis TaxID=860243 RepID=A0A7Z0DNB5_9ACTN|nr:hypothetical protein [Nocardioides panzhihuensis]NYI78806.1 hypothetical protein [Nocardioides panzhihuensis]
MRIPHPGLRAGARTGRAAIGVLVLAGTLLVLPTGPAKGDPEVDPQSASQSSVKVPTPELKALLAANPAEGQPGFDDLPANLSISLTEGTVTTSQHAVVRRSKMSITSRPIWGALYFAELNEPLENPTKYVATCTAAIRCVPDPFYQPSCATADPSTQWMTGYFRSPIYPIKPLEGGGAKVGILVQDKINLIAFGTIPATATLTISVPRLDRAVQPLMAHVWSRRRTRGCVPVPSDIAGASSLVEGKINIQLSDLEVDGVPVDLGPRCQTKRPADLYLWGDTTSGTYSPNGGGPLGAYDGLHPGSRGPLNDPYYVKDNGRIIPPSSGIEVPPFANCGTNGDDLSPLVSAMASGPNNPVRAMQKTLVAINRIPLEDLSTCGGTPTRPQCPLPAPEVPERPPLPDGEGE